MKRAQQQQVLEWSFTSEQIHADPFNTVQVDVLFTQPDGRELLLPAFWAGDQTWKVRYSSSQRGVHRYQSRCSATGDTGLHDQQGTLEILPYTGENALLRHGPLRLAASRRHLEHCDGTPFLWLGDTWWMGLCERLRWPEDFQELTADRVKKGFSVVQIVAGLYPDMEPFDERGRNEAGFPWEKDFSCINPAYFDQADLRLAHVVRAGLVPCIVGSWGYFMDFAGPEVLAKHWRYLVARYGAYPVVWCAAGEALMFYYLKPKSQEEADAYRQELRQKWGKLVRYIRKLDADRNPLTIHPTQLGHDQVDDPGILDLDMLQTGHSGYPSLGPTVDTLEKSLAHEPRLPVLVSEVNYEGIMESSREEVQRFLFWSCLLSGAAGHTYGANGLWQVNTAAKPYGLSPHGSSWGDIPWDQAYKLPGSGQLGIGKRLLERFRWWEFSPHPEWAEPHQSAERRVACYAAGIPGQVRLIFIPAETSWAAWSGNLKIKGLEKAYTAFYFDPKTGREYPLGQAEGDWPAPKPPVFQDWVLVLEAQS